MPVSRLDTQWMARAIQLAKFGLYTTSPNPRVGCVLVNQTGEQVAEGWHQWAGQGHAEVNALRAAGIQAQGTTAYVTLEPCQHTGRTGPCCEALIQAGVSRVVYGMQDPNPQVAGGGLARLREAGVVVDGPVLESCCEALNPGFIKRMRAGRPYVRCKLAMSLDGRTAMASGESQWITGSAARADVQALRARSCAVVTGVDTVVHDNARLNVRDGVYPAPVRQPLRVLLDTTGKAPANAAFFSQNSPFWWVTGEGVNLPVSVLKQEGAAHKTLTVSNDRLNLEQLLQSLGQAQCNEVLIEAGATLAGSFVAAGLVDELIIYMAPTLMGSDARPLLALPLAQMSEQRPLTIADIRAVGNDWRITATPAQNDVNRP